MADTEEHDWHEEDDAEYDGGDGEEEEEDEEEAAEGDDAATHEDVDDEEEEEEEGDGFEDEEDDEGEGDEEDDDMGGPYGDGADDGGAGMFGLNLRAMAGYMSGLSSRFRSLLASLRDAADPTTQLVALQDLAEMLSVSTEDTLAGYFPTDSFVKELVYILGGPKPERPDLNSGGSSSARTAKQREEDEEMAAALAVAAAADGEDDGERQLLACRCLANLIEAMPYAAHSVVSNGAVPVLNAKLMEITFIDLAEQVLQTLEKISQDYPSAIVKNGGLSAILQYLDFFNIHVQRTAMTAAANCCRKLMPESSTSVSEVMPIIRNVLTYSDQRLVESACKCIVRIVESYRNNPELLEQLLSDELLAALNGLLLPASSPSASATALGTSTYTDVLKALGTACRSSPKLAVSLLEGNIVETLYHLLTGSAAPADSNDEAEAAKPHALTLEGEGGTGTNGAGPDARDMAVLQNLAQRSKEQVQEALSLVGELLPPLPRDGVFDSRAYTERAYLKRRAREGSAGRSVSRPGSSGADTGAAAVEAGENALRPSTGSRKSSGRIKSEKELTREAAQAKRVEMLRSRTGLVKRFTRLVLPTLVEVYAASVALHVRSKAINGILKIVSFVEAEPLSEVLDNVPLASFLASILSSRDQPTLVNGALQIVELLTDKLPSVYTSLLRREGVMWEIEDIAAQAPSAKANASSATSSKSRPTGSGTREISLPGGSSAQVGSGGGISTASDPPASLSASSGLARFLAAATGEGHAVQALDTIRELVSQLETAAENGKRSEAREAVQQLAVLFSRAEDPISSFELLRSGLVDSLYSFATSDEGSLPLSERRALLIEALMRVDDGSRQSAAAVLVRRLQESLSRLENVEITTALSGSGNGGFGSFGGAGGIDDSRRSPTAMLGRQLRLRLQAEDSSDIPRSCSNIVVTIHAIATFQSLSDYLRPKISASMAANASGNSGGGSAAGTSSRLSSVLAAFAAATGSPDPSGAAGGVAGRTSASQPSGSAGASRRASTNSKSVGKGKDATSTDAKDVGSSSTADDKKGEDEEAPKNASESSVDQGGDDGFSDEEFEEEILQGEIPAETGAADAETNNTTGADKTINLDVEKEGGKVIAKTPDGTRIATPSNGTGTPRPGESSTSPGAGAAAGSSSSASPSKQAPSSSSSSSYASALQKKPTDWHLEFSLGSQELTLDTTIYGAVHKFETGQTAGGAPSRYIWGNVYTIKFRKVSGATAKENGGATPEPASAPSATIELPPSVSKEAPYAKLLQLLAVLHQLNSEWHEAKQAQAMGTAAALDESAFVNNKLTAKLNRQLEEPMIVASSCLPEWSTDLPRFFPFLFPFEARFAFLQSTSFGYARLITRWQTLHSRNQETGGSASSRLDDSFGFLGRLQRQKVRISRANLLASAFKVFELYGSNSSVLEVEYFEEVGTGLGPTLEFYSLVSKEFARRDLHLWRDAGSADPTTEYVSGPGGLFPAPLADGSGALATQPSNEEVQKRLQAFKILGQFVAKALLDSRIIDCNFSPVFMRAALNQPVTMSLATLAAVDATLARSLGAMQRMDAHEIEALDLDFTVPGHEGLELHAGGRQERVTADNLERYIRETLEVTLDRGIRPAVRAFRAGFNLIFPIAAMSSFTAEELVMLFGNTEEDWSESTLMGSLKPDHGFNAESTTFRDIVAIMASFSANERREFLQWLTGSPKLPIGGFSGLHPQLTIVKRPHEAPLTPDDYLPSVMTCVNYLKMPNYSSREKMRERLQTAMKEGSTSFHLS
ncbi:hypothetical protein BCV70DRAFT_165703 [Testicularia cyperi]|uniref:HECT-type E3 ubiquitin transferase n=1 Tax=Testicularia cyperi TaxID=1882483 RepID=A0A317XIQ4_9BASI|nr:hypothetical protein BCV70DRAFT_165703 [Testicularia cyperi]